MRQQQSLVLLVAMDTLLSWQQKQMLITLLFEGTQTLYLVQMFLEVLVISGISCCYGHNVTMVTEACTCNIAVWRYRNFIFGIHTFWGNSNSWYNLLLWTLSYQQVLITLLFEGTRTSFFVHTFFEETAICRIVCCYGHLVPIATKACAYNIAFEMYPNTPNWRHTFLGLLFETSEETWS